MPIWLKRLISAKSAPEHNLHYKCFYQWHVLFSGHHTEISNPDVGRVGWAARTWTGLTHCSRSRHWWWWWWWEAGGKGRRSRPKTGGPLWETLVTGNAVLPPPLYNTLFCVCAWLQMKGCVVVQEEDSCWRSEKQKQPPVGRCICASHWSPSSPPARSLDTYLSLSFCSLFPPIKSLLPPASPPLRSPCRHRVQSGRALHWNRIHLRFYGDW